MSVTLSVPILALLWLLPVALATYRVTRFITRDQFPLIAVPRERVTNWLDPSDDWIRGNALEGIEPHPDAVPHGGLLGRSIAYLWECDWCVSVWVGSGITYLVFSHPVEMLWVCLALCASALTGLIAQREPE